MATKIRNGVGTSVVINADGFSEAGGTTSERKNTLITGDVSMVGGGSAVITFPSTTDTLMARATADTITGVKTFNAGKMVLAAGSTSAAPITFTPSGTSLMTTAAQGTSEIDSAGILYYSHAASSRGVNLTEQFISQTANRNLTDSSTAQKVFDTSTNGALTVAASTSYFFEAMYTITSTGTTSHTWGVSLAGTATFTSGFITAMADTGSGNALRTMSSIYSTALGTNLVVTAASVSATENTTIFLKGIARINAGGTIIPTLKLSAATTATPVLLANSYFRIAPIGTNTIASVGNWS